MKHPPTAYPTTVHAAPGFGRRLSAFLARLARKSRTFRAAYGVGLGAPTWSARDVQTFAQEGYGGNPYMYAAVNLVVDACASAPPLLYRVQGGGQVERAMDAAYDHKAALRGQSKRGWTKEAAARQIIQKRAARIARDTGAHPAYARRLATKALVQAGELEEIEAHPALDLLARPNGYYQTSYRDFVAAFITSWGIAGEVFTEPKNQSGGPDGEPRELYILPPSLFDAQKATEDNPLPGFITKGRGKERFRFDPDPMDTEIFFTKTYNPLQPHRGLSPVEAAIRSIDLNNDARAYNLAYMQNGGVPSGLLMGEFTKIQADETREKYAAENAGADNAGNLLIFSGKDLKYERTGLDPAKMLWGDTLKLSAREVAIVFGVPPILLGDPERSTYANYQEARAALYQDRALPLCDWMYGAWNATWLRRFGDDLMLDYDTDQVSAIQEDVDQMYARLRTADFMTINEKRGAVGYDPLGPEGDVILVSTTQQPLEVMTGGDEPAEGEKAARLVHLSNGRAA
jgi:HK97 family phage portal protein